MSSTSHQTLPTLILTQNTSIQPKGLEGPFGPFGPGAGPEPWPEPLPYGRGWYPHAVDRAPPGCATATEMEWPRDVCPAMLLPRYSEENYRILERYMRAHAYTAAKSAHVVRRW